MLTRVLYASVAENLKARALRIIHEKERNTVIAGEVSSGKHLPITAVISEGQRLRIQYSKKASATATVLNVRPAIFGDRCHVKAVARLDESVLLFHQHIRFRRANNALRAPAVMFLGLTH